MEIGEFLSWPSQVNGFTDSQVRIASVQYQAPILSENFLHLPGYIVISTELEDFTIFKLQIWDSSKSSFHVFPVAFQWKMLVQHVQQSSLIRSRLPDL